MTIIDAILNAVFPPRCGICDEIIEPTKYFCDKCKNKIELTVGKRCIGCGLSLKECECNRFIYHFDGIVSPYYNSGYAKQAFYNFKFRRNKRLGSFFVNEMALSVKKAYKNYRFDFLTCVCSTNNKSDYKHSEILAKKLAKKLKLKFVDTLRCSKERKVQHTLGFDERFQNVYNAYEAISTYKKKKILLVDDIKTSGATIDECARELKFAGAKSVFCVTALIGSGKNED